MAMVTGACWRALTSSIPGFRPMPERRVALVGSRDFDEAEWARLEKSEIQLLKCDTSRKNSGLWALQ